MASQSNPSPLLSLPPELRLEIYSYLLPGLVTHAAYTGLRQTCHTLRIEYDYEALKLVKPHYPLRFNYYDNSPSRRELPKWVSTEPYRLLNIHILSITMPHDAAIIASRLVPFHIPWIEQVYITLREGEYPVEHVENMIGLDEEIENGISKMRGEGKVSDLGVRKIVVWEIVEDADPMDSTGQETWRDNGWEREFGRVVLREKGFKVFRNEWRRKEEMKVQVGGWLTWTGRLMGWFV